MQQVELPTNIQTERKEILWLATQEFLEMKTYLDINHGQGASESSKKEGGGELATTVPSGYRRHLVLMGDPRLPYLVSIHWVFLLQLTLPHRLILFLIFLQFLGWYLQGLEEKHVRQGRDLGKRFLIQWPIKSLAF